MKKYLIPLVLVFIFSVGVANAQLLLNDTFDRVTLPPWSKFVPVCTSNVVINGTAMIQSQNANCLAFASWTSSNLVSDFYFEFDYSHETDNLFFVEWSSSGIILSIRFDTDNNLIEFSNYTALKDFPALTTGVFLTYPYSFGFASGSVHKINITLDGSVLSIAIDGTPIFTQSNPKFVSAVSIYGLGLFNTGASSCDYDNVVIYSTGALKLMPDLRIQTSPDALYGTSVPFGTELIVTCIEQNGYPVQITMREAGYWEKNGTLSVAETRNFDEGLHVIDCFSYEDATYLADSTLVIVNISSVLEEETVTEAYNISWTQPILNSTETQQAGLGWILPFFTPFFFAHMLLLIVAGGVSMFSKSPIMGGIASVVFFVIYAFIGMYPTWIAIIMVLLAVGVVAMFMKGMVS